MSIQLKKQTFSFPYRKRPSAFEALSHEWFQVSNQCTLQFNSKSVAKYLNKYFGLI